MVTWILGVILGALLGVQQPAAPSHADPREKLDTAIAEAIRILGTKDYPNFLKAFCDPDDLAARRDNFDDFAKEFGRRSGEMLLGVLKEIQKIKPAMSADGLTATYTLEPAPDRPATLRWEKHGKFWYIAN